MAKNKITKDYSGKVIKEIDVGPNTGYEPTFCDITFEDGSRLTIHSSAVMYDQYSTSHCLLFKEK